MPSEYDFLATYSRRLRRVVTLAMVTGAVLAGVFAMGLIIALPLQSRSNSEMPASAVPSQKGAQPTAAKAAKTTTANVEAQNSAEPTAAAAGLAENGAANSKTADAPTPGGRKALLPAGVQASAARAASMRDKPPNETKDATPPAAREDGSTPGPLEMTRETSPDYSTNSTDRRTQKKHAYKRKPQKTRVAQPSEDLRHHLFVDQGGVRQVVPMQSKRAANGRAMVASGPNRFIMWPFNYGQN
jgi:hypothetical protein